MATLRDLQTTLTDRSAEIARCFNLSTDKEPWNRLPEPERLNYLRNLINPLAQAALADSTEVSSYRHALHVAARHGERRHDQGLPEQILFDDIYYFRTALCAQIDPENVSDLYAEAITRIDELLSLATFASLRGYYRDDFEARGQWPETIDEITSRWGPLRSRETRLVVGTWLESESLPLERGSGEFFRRYHP